MIEKTIDEINNLVIKGILPISFFNSKVINLNTYLSKYKNIEYFNEKYQQKSILRHISGKMISKIFEI